MRLSVRRFVVALVAPVVIGALTTCTENNATSRPPTPVTRWAGLTFTPAFSASSKQAAVIYQAAGLEFDRVRVVIMRPPSETLKDTTVNFTVGQSDLVLNLEVPAVPGEQLTAVLEYRSGNLVLFAGSATLTAQALTATTTAPPSTITVTPVGPGATAASVVVSPSSGSFPTTAPVAFSARALTASGTDIAGALFVWSVDNTAAGTIDATTGVVTPAALGGALRVRATTLNGTFGEASVTFVSPPARIVTIGGGGQTGVVGSALGQAFVVEVQAASGTPVPNQVVTFGTSGGASVSPGSATTGANGRAQTTMTLGNAPQNYSFAASVATFSTSVSAVATVGTATSIAAVSGSGQSDTVRKALQNPFVVRVTDQFGNPTPNVTVTWSRTAGTGLLSATTTTTNADGQTNVAYTLGTKVGSETVSAAVGGVTTAATFTVQALPTGPAAIAVVSGGGQTGRASQPLDAPFVVTITDDVGNPVAGITVNWTATNGTIPPTSTTDAQGISSNTLTLGSTVGPATATATVAAGATAKSVSFTVAVQPGIVARVAFRTQPTNGAAGVVLRPAIQVELLDAVGNLTAATNTVSVALGSNPGTATLGGTLTRAAVAGVATFDDITLSAGGTGYTMVVSSAGVPSVTSGAFDISFAAPVAVQFLTQPSNVIAGAAITPAVQVRLVNAQGGTVTTATNNVTIAIGANPSEGTLGGTLTVAAVNGVATFSNLTISSAANGYALTASSTNLTSATSVAFNVTSAAPPPAVGVAFQVAPSNVIVATVMAPAVTVRAVDAQGNTVSSFTGNVTIAIGTNPGTGTLGGTLTRAAVAGVATFNDLTVSVAGNGYTLVASSTGLTGAASFGFNVIALGVGRTWTGAVSTDWFAAGNWSGGGVPSAANNATIPAGTPNQPVLTGAVQITDLTVATGATLSLGSSPLAASGNVDGGLGTGSGITGTGLLSLVGKGTTLRGNVPNVSVQGTITIAGPTNQTGTLQIPAAGNLSVANNTATFGTVVLAGQLTIGAGAVATMASLSVSGSTAVFGQTGGVLTVSGNAVFAGASTSGQVLAGTLTVGGNFTQTGTINAQSFTATGSHVVAFKGTAAQIISFDTPGISHFQDVEFSGTGAVTLNTSIAASGKLISATGPTTVLGGANAATVTSAGFDVDGLILDNVVLNTTGGAITRFDNVTFQHYPAVLTPLTIAHPGAAAPFTFTNTQFLVTPATGGAYLKVTDTAPTDGAVLTINLVNSVPANGATQTVTAGGAVVNWQSAAATALAFQVGPSNVNVATVMAPAVTVRAVDAQGNTVSGFTGNVTIAIGTNPGAGTLGGTLTRAAVAGVATFNDLTVSVAGNGYTLAASSTALTAATSGAFNVIPGPPPPVVGVAFQIAPSNVVVGAAMVPAVTVRAIDAQGATVPGFTGNVTIAIGTNPGTGVLGGTLTRAAIAGVATFNDLTVSAAGNGYTLVASSAGLTGASSFGFNVTAAPPVAVAVQFLVQPSTVAAGNTIAPAVQARLVDAQGATVTTATNTIVIAIGNNPGSGTLSGTLSTAAVNGIATFANLSIGNVGNGYTLTASSTGLSPATSTAFNVIAASQTIIAWTNPAGGLWSLPANWSLGRVPVTSDSVIIALAGTYTVTLDADFTATYITIGAPSGTQTLGMSSRTLTVNNTLTVKATGVFAPSNSTVTGVGTISNQGTLKANGAVTLNGLISTVPGSLIRVDGNNGNASLIVGSAGGLTNNGAIELVSTGSSFSSQLTVVNGSLTNTTSGTITSLPGAQGPRTLAGQLINQGLLTVNQPLTLAGNDAAHTNTGTIDASGADLTLIQIGTSPSITTSGTLTIGAGRTVSITGGTLNFSGGTLAGTGTLSLSSVTANLGIDVTNAVTALSLSTSTINGPGTITNAAGKTLTLVGTTIASTSGLTNLGTIVARGTSAINGSVTTAASSLLRVEGNNGNAFLTVGTAGGMTNNGAIELTTVGSSFSTQLTVSNGSLTNASGGTITSVPGAAGPRTLTAQLINQGLITVNQPLTLNANNAAHTNSGSIDVSGADLTVNQSGAPASITTSGTVTIGVGRTFSVVGGTLNLNGGTLAGTGTLSLSSVTANLGVDVTNAVTALTASNSTFNGPGSITNASGKTLTILGTTIASTSGLANFGTIVTRGTSAINGPVTTATGSLLRVEGSNGNSFLTVGSSGGLTNNGAIELTTVGSSFSSQLTVSNGPLTNATGGTITSLPGAAGPRTLTAQLINQGLLTVNQALTLNANNAAHTNSGTIDVSAADLTLTQNGASPSITTSGTVTIGAGRTLLITGGTLNLNGGTLAGSGTLSLSSLTANLGVNITNAVTSFAVSNSTIIGPGTITNAPGRTLTILGTTIAATSALTNFGTIVTRGTSEIDGPVTTSPGSLIRVEGNNGNAFLTVGSAGGLTNTGAIELTTVGSSFSSQLTVNNGPLTNAIGGTITSVPGAAGPRTITAQLNNQGAFTVNQPLTLNAINVAHVNGGTIDVSGGDLTVTQSGAAASLTTSGTMTVGVGRTLFLTGGTLNLAPTGTLAGSGTLSLSSVTANLGADFTNAVTALVVSNSTINGPGKIINAPSKTLTMLGTTIAATSGLTNQGTVVARGSSEIDGPVTTTTGSLVRVEGNNGNAFLTVASVGGLTNNGAIEIISVGSSFSSQLTVNNGPLTNATGATITTLPGAAGPRTITAQLNNQGVFTVNQALTLNAANVAHSNTGTIDVSGGDLTVTQSGATASVTTSGIVTIGAGRTLFLNGGTLNLSSTGTLGGSGTLNLSSVTANLGADVTNAVTALVVNSSTINGPGKIINAATKTLTLSGTTIAATSGLNNQGTVVARASSEIDGSLATAAGSLLRVEGNNGNAFLTVGTAGGLTNNGAIEIISVGSSFSSQLTVVNGPLTNASGGTITTLPGAAGPRTITAQLNNQGTLTVNQALTLNAANVAHTNSGTLNVNANLTTTQSGGSASFTNSGTATIAAGQTWSISAGTFTQQAGATLSGGGAMSLNNTTAAFNTGFALGALTLTSTNATFQNNLSTAALALSFISSTINGPGAITNPAGQTLTIQSSTIGTTSGLTNQGIVVAAGNSAINGPLTTATGSTLRMEGNSSAGNSALTVGGASGFTNNGAIELTTTGSSFASQLTVTNGTLTNAAGGSITSIVGAGGPRTLAAQLDNQGVITVNEPLTLSAANAVHTNSGTLSVVGPTFNITQSGASASFTNTGTVAIGAAGTLTISGGTFTQQTGATLNGGGALALTNVSAAFKTTFALGTLRLTGTTASIQNDISTTGLSLQLSSSTLNGPGVITNASGQTLTLQASTIGATSGLTNQGTVVVSGTSAINGPLTTAGGSTLRMEGNSSAGNSALTVGAAEGLANNGAIDLTTTGSSFASQLTVTNGTLTNATGGTITTSVGNGGPRTLAAELNNQGLLTVNQPLVINRTSSGHSNSGSVNVNGGDLTISQSGAGATFSNSGTVTVATGRIWAINGGTFTQQAGATLTGAGAMALSNVSAAFNTGFTIASLSLTGTTATIQANLSTATTGLSLASSTINGPGTITNPAGRTITLQNSTIGSSSGLTNQGTLAASGISAINGLLTTASGSLLRMQGNSIVGNSTLTVGGANVTGFTNNGLIDLTTSGSSFASQLTVSNGVLLNAVGGTITSSLGNGGPRTIAGAVNNQGIMTVAAGAAQLLTISGSLVTSGTINLEISGLTAGTQYDRIAISGAATLGGTLNVALVNGFAPVTGNTFDVLTFGSATGDFGTYVLPNAGWTHAQQANLLRLTAP